MQISAKFPLKIPVTTWPSDSCVVALFNPIVSLTFFIFVTNIINMWQAFLKKEQERKEAELLAEKQEVLRKRKEEKRVAREVRNMHED